MSATSRPLHTSDLPVLGATTIGYYLVQDLVRTPWRRRVAGAGVLAAGVAAGYATTRSDATDHADSGDRAAAVDRVTPDDTGHGDAGQPSAPTDPHAAGHPASPRRIALFSGVFAGTLALTAWISARIDRAFVSGVAAVGGRLPLVGRLIRRFPATTWGTLQFGAVAAAELVTRKEQQK